MDVRPSFMLGDTPTLQPESPRRTPIYIGWLVLGAIFTLMISGELITYLARGVPKPNTLSLTDQTQNELALKGVAMQIASTPANTKLEDGGAVARLAPLRLKNTAAAKYYVLMRKELNESIPSDTFAFMMRSGSAKDKAIASIVQTDHLGKEAAAKLSKDIVGDEYSDDLARAYAQRNTGNDKPWTDLHKPSLFIGEYFVLLAATVAACLGAFLLMFYVSRRSRFAPLTQGPFGLLSGPSADRLAFRAAICMTLFIIMGQALGKAPIAAQLVGEAGVTVLCYALLKFPIEGVADSLAKVGLTTQNLGKNILWGIGGAVANVPILSIVTIVSTTLFKNLPPAEHPIGKDLVGKPTFATILPIFIFAAILAPAFEELTFRGLLLPALNGRLKSRLSAIFISSLLFAMIHPTGIPAWSGLAAVGAMSAYLTYQTKSLVPSIVMHAVHNAATLALALLLGG